MSVESSCWSWQLKYRRMLPREKRAGQPDTALRNQNVDSIENVNHADRVTTVHLLLHPVRLRILQAFLGGRELTTSQLAAELNDLPSGGLYRHVSLMANGRVLQVVSERRVRGAVERTYALRQEGSVLSAADMAAFSRQDHAQSFGIFVAALLSEYQRYLAAPDADPIGDGATYSMNSVWLTDEEYGQFLREVSALMVPRIAKQPGDGRSRRLIASAFLPQPVATPGSGGSDD